MTTVNGNHPSLPLEVHYINIRHGVTPATAARAPRKCHQDLIALYIKNDAALDAFSALRRALQFAAILAIDLSLLGDRTFALGRRRAGGGHQALLLALFDVSVPDADDDAVGDDVAQVAVHHLEDEAAVEAEMILDEAAEETAVFRRLELVVDFQKVTNELLHVLRWRGWGGREGKKWCKGGIRVE